MKGFLIRRNVAEVTGCVEKRDLVELILANVGGQSYRDRQLVEQGRLRQLMVGTQSMSFTKNAAYLCRIVEVYVHITS